MRKTHRKPDGNENETFMEFDIHTSFKKLKSVYKIREEIV